MDFVYPPAPATTGGRLYVLSFIKTQSSKPNAMSAEAGNGEGDSSALSRVRPHEHLGLSLARLVGLGFVDLVPIT